MFLKQRVFAVRSGAQMKKKLGGSSHQIDKLTKGSEARVTCHGEKTITQIEQPYASWIKLISRMQMFLLSLLLLLPTLMSVSRKI